MKMWSIFLGVALPVLAELIGAGCGFTQYKDPSSAGTSAGAGGGTRPTGTGTGPTGTGTITTAAAFTQVNAQILQPLCIACHGSGGSPSFSSYSSFATNTTWIVPGNASASAVYNAVQSGKMPQGGASLTSAQLTLMSEWIQGGALNN